MLAGGGAVASKNQGFVRGRRALAVCLAFVVAVAGLVVNTVPAYAAGSIDIVKKLDGVQEGGNTSDIFQTNGLVRYRLKISCSSHTEECGIGTVTDVLDPNLEFVEVIKPTGTMPNGRPYPTMASQYDAASRTVTITIGGTSSPFLGGDQAEFVVVARVKSQPADPDGDGYGIIPNRASAQATGGAVVTTPEVQIRVPAPAPSWGIRKDATDGIVVPGGTEIYNIYWTVANTLGNDNLQSATVVDTYPAGTTVVKADGGVVDTVNRTITWTLGAYELTQLSCQLTATTGCLVRIKTIELAFPNPPFTGGQSVTNKVSADIKYSSGKTGTATDDADTNVVTPVDGLTATKTGPAQAAVGESVRWLIQLKNTGTTSPIAWAVEKIPAGVTNVSIENAYFWTQQVLGSDGVTWTTVTTLPDGPATVRFGTTVGANSTATVYLNGKVTDAAGASIKNCAYGATGSITTPESCVTTNVIDPYTSLSVKKVHAFTDSVQTAVKPGEEFTWAVAYQPIAGLVPKTVNVTDLLPPQFEYVKTICQYAAPNSGWSPPSPASLRTALASTACNGSTPSNAVEPEVKTVSTPVAGTTQLVWKDAPVYQELGQGRINWIMFTVRVKAGAAVSSYTNRAYAETDSMDTKCTTTAMVGTEAGDSDGDGTAGEAVCTATDPVIVDEAAVVDLTKWDKGPLPNVSQTTGLASANCPDWEGYTRYPCVAQTPPNGDFSYRFKMQNIGNIDVTNHVMYDILPFVGDTGVGQLLSNESRATEWTPTLRGPIVIESQPTAAQALVEYNLTTNPCRPELAVGANDANWQASCDDNWYTATQVTDWSLVKSFRVTSFPNKQGWHPLEQIVMRADMHAPATAAESTFSPNFNLSIAWNSTAHRSFRLNGNGSTERLLAAEPRKVGIIVPFDGVSVGDYVWYDTDRDGVQEDGEKPAPGVTVTLKDADGKVVGTAVTDADGYYYFQYLKVSSAYTLTFTAPSGYQFTKQNASSDTSNSVTGDLTDSDADITTGVISFTSPADGDNLAEPGKADNPGLDAGLVTIRVPVSIGDYTWYDTNKDGVQDGDELPASGVAVKLFKDGVEVGSTTTDTKGYYAFGDLDPSTEYTVTFYAPANHAFTTQNAGEDSSNSATADLTDSDADPATGSVTLTTPSSGSNLTDPGKADNPGIDAGFVPLVSIGDYAWLDINRDGLQGDPSVEAPLAGVTVTLKDADGKMVSTTTTDENGYYAFKNLASSTDYSVTFTAPDGYKFTKQDAAGDSSNAATTDLTDSDANSAGVVNFTSPASGSNLTDPAKADNHGLDVGFVGLINLVLEKELVPGGPYYQDSTVTFTLTPSNEGPFAALAGWSVTDILPTGLTLTDMAGEGYQCDLAAATCVADAGLAVGASGKPITVTASVDSGVTGPLKNVAYVSPAEGERPETNPLDKPSTTTDTKASETDNDAQAVVNVASLVSVGDYVWWDANRDGQQSEGELPVEGVVVNLYYGTLSTPMASTKTNEDGYYWFSGLTPGIDYRIVFEKPEGAVFTAQTEGEPATDSDADPFGVVTFTAPESGDNEVGADKTDDPTIDAGLLKYNLVLLKSRDTAGKVYAGSTVQFTLTPSNDGPVSALAGWSVTDILPAGLTIESMTGDGYTCDTDTLTCTATTALAAGATGNPITVVAKVDAGFKGTAKNVAYVSPDEDDIEETNPLDVPDGTTDTVNSRTDNDAEAPITVDSLVSIGDYTWWDVDRDGTQSTGDVVAPNIKVNLYAADGETWIKSTTSDANGFYSFVDLTPGMQYVVEFVKPSGATFTAMNAGADDTVDSDAAISTGRVTVVAPSSGDNSATDPDNPTIDAGLVRFNLNIKKALVTQGPFYAGSEATFTLTPHNDGEVTALAGWSVIDILPEGLTLVSMSGEGYRCQGVVCVSDSDLAAGADGNVITVVVKIAPGVKTVQQNITYVAPAPGDIDETNPLVIPVRGTKTGQTDTDNDAEAELPVMPLVSVGDYVWLDKDRDGLQDEGEAPVPNVTVRLYAADGTTLVAETTTDANGFYSFIGLRPNTAYVMEFVKPAGYVFTGQGASNAGLNSDADISTGRVSFTTPADGDNSAVTPDDPTIDAGLVTYDLTIDKKLVGSVTVIAGDTVTFTLVPSNLGPADVLPGWTVTEQLPEGLSLVSMTGEGYDCSDLVCTAQDGLAAGASGEKITVVAKVDIEAEGELVNVAVVEGGRKDVDEPNKKNNTDDAPVHVVLPVVPALPKTDGLIPWAAAGLLAILAGGGILGASSRWRRRES